MSLVVNDDVVTGLAPFPVDGVYQSFMPKIAAPACLSQAENAPWTNRVPAHEPWARTMMGNSTTNGPSDESGFNTGHEPQFTDDGGKSSESINRVEGEDTIPRGQFWRR
jgi:hypothetical protein